MEVPYRGSGTVFYKEKEYKCDLFYNQEEGGILIKIIHTKVRDSFLEIPVDFNCLFGQLNTGFIFTLYNATRTRTQELISYGKTEYTYVAERMICGVGGKEQKECELHKVIYTLSDIIEWGEMSLYETNENHDLHCKLGAEEKVLYENDEFQIIYKVYGAMIPLKHELYREKIVLKQHGTIIIQASHERHLDYYNSLFKKVKELIEVSLLEKVNIESVGAYSGEIYDYYNEQKKNRELKIYGIDTINNHKNEKDHKLNKRFSWISMSELVRYKSLGKYFEKYELFEPVLELYIECISTQGSPRRNYLNIVQALETYHSRFITNNFKEFKERVNKVVKVAPPQQEQQLAEYLMAGSKKEISLESRLADLIYSMGSDIDFDTGNICRNEFPRVIAKTRNYYIHYNEQIKKTCRILSINELKIYNRALCFLLEYHILQELGYTDKSQLQKKLDERWGSISRDLEILNKSKNMN